MSAVTAMPTRESTRRRLPPPPLPASSRARIALEVIVAYAQARRELRRAPIEQVVARLRAESPTAPATATATAAVTAGAEAQALELEDAKRLGWIVARTLRFMPGDTRCLARSLVLTRLLAQRGIAAKLVIGAHAEPQFMAHAWVECAGEPVLSAGDGSFGRLVEL